MISAIGSPKFGVDFRFINEQNCFSMPSKSPLLLGAHVSTSGGCAMAIDRAVSIGCTAMQIFVKNNMQWFAAPLPAAEAGAFRHHPRREELRAVFGHTGYLI